MKKFAAVSMGILLTAFLLAGCGAKANGIEEGPVASGDTLTIVYKSNPTTGFSWAQKVSNDSVLAFQSDVYTPTETESGMVGTGGSDTFTYKARKAGTAVITLSYAQQWTGGEKGDTHSINVTVDDKGKIISATEGTVSSADSGTASSSQASSAPASSADTGSQTGKTSTKS